MNASLTFHTHLCFYKNADIQYIVFYENFKGYDILDYVLDDNHPLLS